MRERRREPAGDHAGFQPVRGTPEDEAPLAARSPSDTARRTSCARVDGSEFRADLPPILEAMDQPSIDGVNTWFVSKAAAKPA